MGGAQGIFRAVKIHSVRYDNGAICHHTFARTIESTTPRVNPNELWTYSDKDVSSKGHRL